MDDSLLQLMTVAPEGSAPSIPIFTGHVEAKAAEALNVLIFAHGGGDAPIHAEQLIPIRAAATSLVDCLFPIKGDYAEFAGADSLDGIDYIHPTRVATLAVVIGRVLGLPRSELINVAMAAALMNVGYLALRRSLLDQPRRLLDGEWEEHIQTHPDRSVRLLTGSGLPEHCLHAIEQHHERWNGSGYPAGAEGDAISRFARILAVADTYVSLRSIRPQRPPIEAGRALEEIAAGRGKLFDPGVVDAFEDVVARFTGIERPARTASMAESRAKTAAAADATAWRDAGGAVDGDAAAASQRSRLTEGEAEHPPRPRPVAPRRSPEPEAEHDAGIAVAATLPRIRTIDGQPVAPVRATQHSVRAVREVAAAGRRRPRGPRVIARHAPARHALFAPKLYVDAALCGRWPIDRLPL